jgi:hypothetical protein
MVCVPTARLEVLKLAVVVPPVVLSVPWPMLVVPSENVTVPVGLATAVLPGLLTVTVTVNDTVCPDTDGLSDDTTTVPVLALPTVSVMLPVLPTASLDVLKLAVVVPPVVLRVPWPMLVVPSENVTVPVGLATAVLPGLLTDTVAV